MPTQSIPLTPAEASGIAQRALIERMVGRPGIWSHLVERIRADRRRPARPRRRVRVG